MEVDHIVEGADAVIVEGRYHGLYIPIGKRMHAQVCHVWRFGSGKVQSFHQYLNTSHLHDVMDKSRIEEQVAL